MKLALFLTATLALLLCSVVECKPPQSEIDEDTYGLDDVQDDHPVDYEDGDAGLDENDGDEPPEENNSADEPLTIITQGTEFVRNLNDTVVLPCDIVGGESPVQIWSRDLRNHLILFQGTFRVTASPRITRLENGSLQIENLTVEDAGDYECSAVISEANRPKIKHTLHINLPPTIAYIAVKDNKTDIRAGGDLELTCKAEGYPKPTISWHHLNKASERLDLQGETITISNVTHRESGTYRCLADNKLFPPANAQIDVKVEYKPIVTIEKITVNSDVNLDEELKCTVHSEPKATVVWKKNRQNIKNSEHTQLSTSKNNHILLIKGLRDSDFGEYECVAANYIGNTERTVKLVLTPAILRFVRPPQPAKDVVLTWEVESKTPVKEHELQYRKKGSENWHLVTPEVTQINEHTYSVRYSLIGLEPGSYETRIRSRNDGGWSGYSEIMPFAGVYAKHGHQKGHKKGHSNKDNKHFTTQEPTEDTPAAPAEHQEVTEKIKDSPVGASQDGASTSSHLSFTASLLLSCLLLVVLRQ